jgi:hypothetical protein
LTYSGCFPVDEQIEIAQMHLFEDEEEEEQEEEEKMSSLLAKNLLHELTN